MLKKIIFTLAIGLLFQSILIGQVHTNKKILEQSAIQLRQIYQSSYQKAVAIAQKAGRPISFSDENGNLTQLVGLTQFGKLKYYTTFNNTIAAATTGASQLWSGGSTGLNLSGSSASMKNKLGIWDGGNIRATHKELNGRIVVQDGISQLTNADHPTHVAGTMIASGVNPISKGMAYGAQNLLAWDFDKDIAEITAAAPTLLLSNHSYGIIAGWQYDGSRWIYNGDSATREDFKFGYYSHDAQSLDNIAFNAPYYLIVKAAGNSRNQRGPAIGAGYYRYDNNNNLIFAGLRPSGATDSISSNSGYDIIPWDANAKNILTVGAVNGLAAGYTKTSDVTISSFSSWGPTDDGRIKPDLVADGVALTSCTSGNDSAYGSKSGTSMASPNVTGTLFLLQEYYNQKHPGQFMRSATLKGLAIHTADEAGASPGPDYIFGWGLLDAVKAAAVITAAANNTGTHILKESALKPGTDTSFTVVASGNAKLMATICWTDVEGAVETDSAKVLNNRKPKLVNDLDIKLTKNGTTYQPWVLDPNFPSAAASKGNNVLDNVERVEVDGATNGQVYTVTISHKGTLVNKTQAYSLVVSGVGGTILPLQLLYFIGTEQNNQAILNWQTTNEENTSHFEILYSTNGKDFSVVGTVNTTGNGNVGTQNYNYQHAATSVTNYYQLKIVDKTGVISYSPVVTVTLNNTNGAIVKLSPNPIVNGKCQIQINGLPVGVYTATFINAIGQATTVASFGYTGGVYQRNLVLPNLAPGVYQLKICSNNTAVVQKAIVR